MTVVFAMIFKVFFRKCKHAMIPWSAREVIFYDRIRQSNNSVKILTILPLPAHHTLDWLVLHYTMKIQELNEIPFKYSSEIMTVKHISSIYNTSDRRTPSGDANLLVTHSWIFKIHIDTNRALIIVKLEPSTHAYHLLWYQHCIIWRIKFKNEGYPASWRKYFFFKFI